jgi:hypothetical protein
VAAETLHSNSADICLLVDEIGPQLVHFSAMFQIDCRVVVSPHLILIGVGQLCFDPVGLEQTSFDWDGGRATTQAMCRLSLVIIHPITGIEHRIFADNTTTRISREPALW